MTMDPRNSGTMVPQGGSKMSKMAKNAFQQGLQAGAAYLMSNPKGALKKGKDAWNYMTAGGVPSGIVHSGGMKGAIMAPVAVTRQLRGSKPKFSGRTSGSVTVSHRELITQVNNSTQFVVNGGVTGNLRQVNPLNGTLFSWLPSIAANFDQYTFNSVTLHYVPLCATTETGRVAMYFDKDSEDPEPADRVELANYATLKETAPWAEAMLRIPTDRIKRHNDDSSVNDRKLIDLGQIGIATYGGSGTNPVGDVFISNSVTLHFPQPTAVGVQTRRLDLTSVLDTNVGPSYTITSSTATVYTVAFRTVGTFMLLGAVRSTGSPVIGLSSANIAINSNTTLNTVGTAFSYMTNVTVSALPASITFTVVGVITSSTSHAVRASRTNNADLI
uniref:Capsid protein n=1 Tax=Carnation Italian ringspot virus TaxID=39443 RepID=B3GE97_CIRV|nr:coat protein [Carnation Italian ringspot virus]